MVTPTQLKSLQKVLTFDHPPLCSGAISQPSEGFHLWYDKKNPKFIDFASATPNGLDLLASACDPATFGHEGEDVYDESYRKALKMDASNFAVNLDLANSDLIRTIEYQLLHDKTELMRIRSELYNNIYDEGSFFKPHHDTPRGRNILGSLVIIYPTAHEGGELVLRHKDREWKFDAKSLTASRSSPSLAYVAFYSDTEHEVLKVTSGRRVTITYNLYMVTSALELGAWAVIQNPACASGLQTTLRTLLESPDFLPEGGNLGFGLVHLYPISPQVKLQETVPFLKGEDAHIFKVCRELQLEPLLKVIYEDSESYEEHYGIMMDRIVEKHQYDYENNESYEVALISNLGGVPVNKIDGATIDRCSWVSNWDCEGEYIHWVSPFDTRTRLWDTALRYGNEVYTGYVYCSPCMIVHIAPAIQRLE